MASTAAAADAPPLKKRSVVSSFIIKYPPEGRAGKPMVALFKRGGQVSTYRHHWAPISGGIETTDPSPLAAAWRELHEETTLTPAALELVRQGKSYTFGDPSVGREWTIYPFAFRLKADASAIQIDWEHEGWAWFDPLDVEDNAVFGGVPNLATSLRRAWFEKDLGGSPESAGGVLARGLEQLQNDQQSGARQLAGVALGVLRDVVQALDADVPDRETWWARVRFAAWHIWKNGRESMGAAIMSVLLDALGGAQAALDAGGPLAQVRAAVVGDLAARIDARAQASSAGPVSDALLAYLEQQFLPAPETAAAPASLAILTLSESSTISYFLQQLVARSRFAAVDLRVLESRPLFEGVSLAASLVRYAQSGAARPAVKVAVYTDASAALAAAGADVVLLGADRIASTGAVSNKTGSLPAVLCAKAGSGSSAPSRTPQVVVLGETDKIATPGDPREHVVEDNNPAQLTRDWHSSCNSQRVRDAADTLASAMAATEAATDSDAAPTLDVQVRNVSFEWVPPSLIDAYVTEHGVWTVEAIGRQSAKLAEDEARFFNDL